MNKYHNQKTTVCGKTFDSRHEAERYIVLRSLEQSGVITDLRLQVPYELIPTQRIGGKMIRCGVCAAYDGGNAQGRHIMGGGA